MEIKIIQIGEKTFKLIFDDVDEELDIDSLLKIDYSNLIGEIITFPVIVNRFGILLAEAESQAAEAKLNLEVFEAKTKEKLRIELAEQNGGKAPTVEALNNAVISNKAYQVMRKKLIEAQKTRDYINSIFWASKDKSEKLNKLSLTIQQGDITSNMIEGKINNILIKQTKKLID
mgnify:CR=1 FL=1